MSTPSDKLALSVAIATWNRADLLREALESLTAVCVPPDVTWEVLVCDNNSRDHTKSVISQLSTRLPLRYLFEERQGKAYAVQRLLETANGEWVLLIDDDIRVDPQWLEAYADGVRRYPRAGCLGGQVHPRLEHAAQGSPAFLLRRYPWMYALVRFENDDTISPEAARLVHGANMAVRREAVRPADDVDTRRGVFGKRRIGGEDIELTRRILERGWEGWRLAKAVAYHFIPRSRLTWRWILHWQLAEARSLALTRGLEPGSLSAFRLTVRFLGREARWLISSVLRPHVSTIRVRLRRAVDRVRGA